MSFPLRKLKKKKKDEAKGAGAVAPGSSFMGAIGTAAPTGAASTGAWGSIVTSISSATGLSAVAASKISIAAIVVAVSSGVAGFSFIMGNSTPEGRRSMKRRVFALETTSQETTAANASKASRTSDAAADPSSLEYTPKIASNLPEAEPIVDGPAPVVTPPSQEEINAATEKIIDAPVAKKKYKKVKPSPKPKLAKKSGVKTRSSNAGTKAALIAMDSLAGGPRSTFQNIYKNGEAGAFSNKGQRRPRFGANRKSVPINSGSRAMDQARFANNMSRSGARMGRTSGASHMASAPFDGSNRAARALGKSQGTGLGGTGMSGSANSALDTKIIDPPPAPEDIKKGKDETPYKGMLMAAMGALGLGTILLMAAGKMISSGRSNPTPAGAAMVAQGKALAMAAMGAGGAAAGIGAMIAGEHGQMTQAIPFITGGGILAMQAGMVLAKADSAGQEASSGIESAAGQAAQTAGQALSRGMQQNKTPDSDPPPEEKKIVNIDRHSEHYQGDIPFS